jgi:hypothetical protein
VVKANAPATREAQENGKMKEGWMVRKKRGVQAWFEAIRAWIRNQVRLKAQLYDISAAYIQLRAAT